MNSLNTVNILKHTTINTPAFFHFLLMMKDTNRIPFRKHVILAHLGKLGTHYQPTGRESVLFLNLAKEILGAKLYNENFVLRDLLGDSGKMKKPVWKLKMKGSKTTSNFK